jgi:hypothetical protein
VSTATRTRKPSATEEVDEEFPVVLDPSKPMIISAWGRKGSGKSTFNRRIYDSWPYDKLCIDVNGDADPGPDAERVNTPLPSRFPAPATPTLGARPQGPRNLHYVADVGSATYRDDLDRAVGLALFPKDQRTLVWCGEVAEFMPHANSADPHMRVLLHQNRHYAASVLFDGPRPMNVDPLTIGQSDLIAIYHLPNPKDVQRLAENMGYPPARLYDECQETWRRGKYWFLLWDAPAHKIYRCPPLPQDED